MERISCCRSYFDWLANHHAGSSFIVLGFLFLYILTASFQIRDYVVFSRPFIPSCIRSLRERSTHDLAWSPINRQPSALQPT